MSYGSEPGRSAEAARVACRFRASWSEGQVARESFNDEIRATTDGRPSSPVPAEVLRQARTQRLATGALSEILQQSHSKRLSSIYDAAGMTFHETTPLYVEHAGIEIGRVLVVDRAADRYEVQGWVHPDFAAAVLKRGFVSPGLWIDDAEIVSFGGPDLLHVTRSTLAELSITAEPSRSGTSCHVGAPQDVPPYDWQALLTEDSAFALTADELQFRDGPSARLRIAFPGPIEVIG